MRVVGPKSMGLINTDPDVRLNASLSRSLPPHGSVAMSSQSGALGLAMLALARHRHLGVSTFIGVGNKADISGNDLLQYWQGDEATRVVLLYLESFGNPRRFARIARGVSRSKPIVVVKSGPSAGRGLKETQGRKLGSSGQAPGPETAGPGAAAVVADDMPVDALFRQTGVIRAETLDEMFDLAAALDRQPLPAGRRVAILSDGVVFRQQARQNRLAGAPCHASRRDALPDRLQHRNRIVRVERGMDRDQGIDLGSGEVLPARAQLERLLEWVAPLAQELGAAQYLAVPAANSAERQIAQHEDGETMEEIYAGLVRRGDPVRG